MFVIFNQHSCHTFQNGYIETEFGAIKAFEGVLFIARAIPFSIYLNITLLSPSLFSRLTFRRLRHSYSKYLLMNFFLFDEVSGLCNSLNTLLVVLLQDNNFLNWSSSPTNAAPF